MKNNKQLREIRANLKRIESYSSKFSKEELVFQINNLCRSIDTMVIENMDSDLIMKTPSISEHLIDKDKRFGDE
jgi:hypothetical protein